MSQVFIHSKPNRKDKFPTKETFKSPEDLHANEDYPQRLGDSFTADTNNRAFFLSSKIVKDDGTVTSHWNENSRRKARTEPKSYKWHTAPYKEYILSPTAKILEIKTMDEYKEAVKNYPGYPSNIDPEGPPFTGPEGLDYNKLREEGYDGFHIHQEAFEEASEIYNKMNRELELLQINWRANSTAIKALVVEMKPYSLFDWWEAEFLCVWNWCFEDN
jgi:hypothetical protein